MVNIPQPEEIIAEAVSLVRPGGSVAFHEADWAIHICAPPQQAWDRAGDLLIAYAQSAGIDLFVGRKMPRLLRAAGLVDVHAHPLIHMYPPGHARRPILLDFVNDVSDRMVETGIASVTELAELTDSLRRHLDTRTPLSSHTCSFKHGAANLTLGPLPESLREADQHHSGQHHTRCYRPRRPRR